MSNEPLPRHFGKACNTADAVQDRLAALAEQRSRLLEADMRGSRTARMRGARQRQGGHHGYGFEVDARWLGLPDYLAARAQERLAALVEERRRVAEEEERGCTPVKAGAARAGAEGGTTAEMVAKEAKRLEVMKRRQEREMGQMVAYEVARKKMQVCEACAAIARLHPQSLCIQHVTCISLQHGMLALTRTSSAQQRQCTDPVMPLLCKRVQNNTYMSVHTNRSAERLSTARLQDKAEAKLATLEARAEEARREAASREKTWRLQQHERELARHGPPWSESGCKGPRQPVQRSHVRKHFTKHMESARHVMSCHVSRGLTYQLCALSRCTKFSKAGQWGRAEEEEQREAEVKAIDAARYEHEMEMAQQEAEEERIRRKEAYARWAVSHNTAFACDVDNFLQACRKRQPCMHKCMTAHLCIMPACKEHPQGRSEHIHSLPALTPCNPPGYPAGRWSGASR